SGRILRPSRGTAPSSSKKLPDTPVVGTFTGSPAPSSTAVQNDELIDATLPTAGVASPTSRTWRYDSSMTRTLSAALVPHPTTRLPGSRIGIGFNSTE